MCLVRWDDEELSMVTLHHYSKLGHEVRYSVSYHCLHSVWQPRSQITAQDRRHFFGFFDFAADDLVFDEAAVLERLGDEAALDDAPVLEEGALFDDGDEGAVLEADFLVCLSLTPDFSAADFC